MLVVVAPAAAAIVLFHPVASPSLAMRRSQGSGVSPGHKLIDAAGGPAVDELGQHICEPSVRIDAIEFARLCRPLNYAEETHFPQDSR